MTPSDESVRMFRMNDWERYKQAMIGLHRALSGRPTAAKQIAATAQTFTSAIRAAIGPEKLREDARQRYIDGHCSLEQYEAELDRLNSEFGPE